MRKSFFSGQFTLMALVTVGLASLGLLESAKAGESAMTLKELRISVIKKLGLNNDPRDVVEASSIIKAMNALGAKNSEVRIEVLESFELTLESAISSNDDETLRALIKEGCDVNGTTGSDDHVQPLIFSALYVGAKAELLEELLKAGANSNALNKEGASALRSAAEAFQAVLGYTSSEETLTRVAKKVKLLLEYGANPALRAEGEKRMSYKKEAFRANMLAALDHLSEVEAQK